MATVAFDLGGVVVLWDPVPAVAAAVGLERAENFVRGGKFDFAAWNHAQDAGRSWAEAEAEAMASHPDFAEEVAAYDPTSPFRCGGWSREPPRSCALFTTEACGWLP